ncbi:MAG: SDR family NAD(P)-dependent oxidoreductase [Pseudomonadota bacterium]
MVTGASGSLGRAIALQHVGPWVDISLWGRDSDRLDETRRAVEARGATAKIVVCDVTQAQDAADLVAEEDASAAFDIAYLVAGTGETKPADARFESPELVVRSVLTNFAGPAAMAAALADRMSERGSGRIVLIGSAAGHHSLPFASAYAGSKAGLARYADALRIAAAPHGVCVTLAAPGFLDTPGRTDNAPMLLAVDEAARRIIAAGERGDGRYVTPWTFRALRALDAVLPVRLRDALLKRLEP